MEKTLNLEQLIPTYAANKAELDGYKKICDEENAQIKSLMVQADLKTFEAGGYKATYSVQQRTSVNEEMLLEIAHHHGIKEIVKTKEYIDFDVLEDLIYRGTLSQDIVLEMNKATQIKEVQTLKVTKIKEK